MKGQKEINGTPLNRRINYKNVSLSCTNYRQLHDKKIDVFTEKSIVCLDGDQEFSVKNMGNFIDLPTKTIQGTSRNPEEFIYDVISDEASNYWKHVDGYNYTLFMHYHNCESILQLKSGVYKQASQTSLHMKPRELWKDWFNYQKQFWKNRSNNPIDFWKKQPENRDLHRKFLEDFEEAYNYVAKKLKIDEINIDYGKF